MKLSSEDLNILLDGTEDTKIRIKEKEIPEDFDYKTKVDVLNRRIKRELVRRQKKFANSVKNSNAVEGEK